ncbi:MAG: FGGY-family carbohydrate kinase [Clostridia bacterium]|nr:FGGY-family carbohydrate kinase [Clostridia bacterium]
MLYMGIDVGTQGVRCVVADEKGSVAAAKSVAFAQLNVADGGLYEQVPAHWRAAAETAVMDCTAQLRKSGADVSQIKTISIDGTSGTIVPLDRDFQPLTNGLMYNDPRAKAEAAEVHAAMGAHEKKLGLKFGASFSLPRVLWFLRQKPEIYEKTRIFAHQADYIAGLLCGEYCVSDYSNALKTGYDLIDGRWPEEISVLGIDAGRLPAIVRPGARIAPVTKEAAARLGLSEKTVVVGGSTDGYASALAAGAVKTGSWASIIGTTFVLKGVTEDLIIDPNGSSYSHRLPSGEWMLGGASNLGGKCLNLCAGGHSFDELNAASESLIPTGVRCYPLTGRGERFPFVDANFEPFYIGNIFEGRLYPALMEGVGFGERYAFERMMRLGAQVGGEICTTGGACRSALWLRIRASILNRCLKVPKVVDAAMGSALVAASEDFGSLGCAAEHMIQYEKTVEPDANLVGRYDEIYHRFERDLEMRLN